MFSVWCFSDISEPPTINSLDEKKAAVLAEAYPQYIYFFSELD